MAYSRVNWQDDKTPLSANNLNHMDEAIYNMSSSLDTIVVGGKITGSSIVQDSVPGNAIIDGSIDGRKLASGSVSNSKIQDGAVITEKIQNNAVTTEKISDGAITSDKIGNGQVVTKNIKDGAVTNNKLANKSVTANKVSSSGITQGKTLISDGNGGASWQSIPTASGTVQRVVYNGTTYTAVDGTATFNQTQGDFNEADPLSPAFIKNKPSSMSIPTPTQADMNSVLFVNALGNYAIGCPTEFRMGNWLIQSSETNGFVIKWVGGNS